MIYESNRLFQLWDYTVGHAQMLLRSPASKEEPDNIDVVLVGVKKLEIPTIMQGLMIEGPEPSDRRAGDPTGFFRITTGGQEYRVVAVACKVYRNRLELRESSLEYFSQDQNGKDLGETLCHSGTKRLSEPASQASS